MARRSAHDYLALSVIRAGLPCSRCGIACCWMADGCFQPNATAASASSVQTPRALKDSTAVASAGTVMLALRWRVLRVMTRFMFAVSGKLAWLLKVSRRKAWEALMKRAIQLHFLHLNVVLLSHTAFTDSWRGP